MPGPSPSDRDGPPAFVKVAVVAFLATFALLAVQRVEAWPFTAWRLFSERRGPVATAPRPFGVSSDGVEYPIDVAELPVAYRQANRLLIQFDRFSEQERRAVCEGLAEGVRDAGHDLEELRVYRVTARSRVEDGEPVAQTTRELTYTCPAPAEGS